MLAILRPERAGQSLYASQPQAPATSGGGSVRVSAPLENIATGFRTISPDQSAPAAQPLPVGQAPAGVGRPTGPAPAAPAAPAR
jgi:hypothetical protein